MDYLLEFYRLLAADNEEGLRKLNIPVSDVFYARAAIKDRLGIDVDIDDLQKMMREEGMIA